MAAASQPAPRYHDLDALRAVATLLGIALHGAFFVLPELIYPWPVHDKSVGNDPTYHIILDITHGLRTPVFYLLSGLFSVLLWERRGVVLAGDAAAQAHRPPAGRRVFHHNPSDRPGHGPDLGAGASV